MLEAKQDLACLKLGLKMTSKVPPSNFLSNPFLPLSILTVLWQEAEKSGTWLPDASTLACHLNGRLLRQRWTLNSLHSLTTGQRSIPVAWRQDQ